MAHPSSPAVPSALRGRLETARLDLLALFRAIDRMDLSPAEIPQRLLRQLLNWMPISWKLSGRWTSLPDAWICVLCSVTL